RVIQRWVSVRWKPADGFTWAFDEICPARVLLLLVPAPLTYQVADRLQFVDRGAYGIPALDPFTGDRFDRRVPALTMRQQGNENPASPVGQPVITRPLVGDRREVVHGGDEPAHDLHWSPPKNSRFIR